MSDIAEKILNRLDAIEQTGRLGDPPLGFLVDDREYSPDDVQIVYESGRGEPDAALRRCAADREIIQHYRNLVETYQGLKSLGDMLNRPSRDLPALEACIADFAAVILPALARGYGVTDE